MKVTNKSLILTDSEIREIYTVFSNANNTVPLIRKEHINALKESTTISSAEAVRQNHLCSKCKKQVSEKVASYCLANIRFNGKIYCYEHQKNIK
ncbi:hypothetical protein V7056_19965 [Bacillus sp. JJ664]